jgi:hypothetical protein
MWYCQLPWLFERKFLEFEEVRIFVKKFDQRCFGNRGCGTSRAQKRSGGAGMSRSLAAYRAYLIELLLPTVSLVYSLVWTRCMFTVQMVVMLLLQLAADRYTQRLGQVLLYSLSVQPIRLPICIRLSLADLITAYRLAVLAKLMCGNVLWGDPWERRNTTWSLYTCSHCRWRRATAVSQRQAMKTTQRYIDPFKISSIQGTSW